MAIDQKLVDVAVLHYSSGSINQLNVHGRDRVFGAEPFCAKANKGLNPIMQQSESVSIRAVPMGLWVFGKQSDASLVDISLVLGGLGVEEKPSALRRPVIVKAEIVEELVQYQFHLARLPSNAVEATRQDTRRSI